MKSPINTTGPRNRSTMLVACLIWRALIVALSCTVCVEQIPVVRAIRAFAHRMARFSSAPVCARNVLCLTSTIRALASTALPKSWPPQAPDDALSVVLNRTFMG